MDKLSTLRRTGGVLEEVLHTKRNYALEGGSRLAVLNAEGFGVEVVCDGLRGIVHVVSDPKRATTSRSAEAGYRVI